MRIGSPVEAKGEAMNGRPMEAKGVIYIYRYLYIYIYICAYIYIYIYIKVFAPCRLWGGICPDGFQYNLQLKMLKHVPAVLGHEAQQEQN